jgi:REP element-mobilizing transposase RayT
MSVRREITEYSGIFFITFTCCRWLHLFEEANAYNSVYDWFDCLKQQGHFVCAYVIMPNHLHVLIAFRNTKGQSINSIVGSGKRFMAYDIVKRLRKLGKVNVLRKLELLVNKEEKLKGKLHEIFEPSFDWKMCDTEKFVYQKLDYIHENPFRGKWHLCQQLEDYVHSSASYYATGKQGIYEVTNIAAIEDIDLTIPLLDDN